MFIIKLIGGWINPYKTRKERIKIYKGMLASLKDDSYRGFCSTLHEVTGEDITWVSKNFHRFPELYGLKPPENEYHPFWFPLDEEGMQKRREILIHIIERYE